MRQFLAEPFPFKGRFLLAALSIATLAGPLLGTLVDAPQLRAQSQANDAPLPSFEVASIRMNKSRFPLPGAHLFGDRFNATTTARGLIVMAYGCHSNDQISGGPDWIKSEIFNVDAKVEDPLFFSEWKKLSFDQQWEQAVLMLRPLLADRFQLKIRHETKDLPIYALVLAKNGPKLAEDRTNQQWGLRALGPGKRKATALPLSIFVEMLSSLPELGGRIVLDKTGLQGRYNFTLQWAPETLATSGRPVH